MMSVAVMLLFSVMFPPPPPAKQPAGPGGAQQEGEGDANDGKADVANAVADAQEGPAEQPADDPPVAPVAQVAADDVPTEFRTLGSLDPESGYRMLVTLTNAGAAVRRAEMTSPRYRDQDDRSGYLGELELTPVNGGVRVQAVGAGTPAADAGIQVGDVIVGVGQPQTTEIRSAADLAAVLSETEPEDSLTLQVRRGDESPQPRTVKQLIWRPFAVLRPEIENYRMRDAEPPPDFHDPASFLLNLISLNGKQLERAELQRMSDALEIGNWRVARGNDELPAVNNWPQPGESSVTFYREIPELNLVVFKAFTLEPAPQTSIGDANFPGYHLQLDVAVKNTGTAAQTVAYRMSGPTGMPLEGWWYAHKISRHSWFGGAGLRDVVVRFDGHQTTQFDCPQIAKGSVEPMADGQALAYAGVDGQYFAAVLIPMRSELNDAWFDVAEAVVAGTPPDARTPVTYTNVTCRLSRQTIPLAAGAIHRDSYQVFLGPKRPALLAQYQAAGDPDHSLRDIVYYGLALFGAVARAMLAILHFFYSIVGNYGIAIVMLTVLVRGAMFPISFKQTQNMARMQALKPEMDRITEKYKTDMQKRSAAIQELYRKHNINPLGGCLPVFLQLPIFIGLYRALMVDVELRLSPLFGHAIRWCSNLAAPDMFLDWSGIMPAFIDSGQGIFALGPYLNILPIVTVALFLVTQKMAMPAPTNEQAAMQQKMMKYMTIFMGLLFYKVASGLCLYFIASSLWGIAERKLLPKSAPPGEATEAKAEKPSRAAATSSTAEVNGSRAKKRPKAKRKR
jgi:YidC/Oxa1 family membrane protein insertase